MHFRKGGARLFDFPILLAARLVVQHPLRHQPVEELDEAVLNRLISKFLVGEVKKIDGQKVQEVRIVYSFVGEISEMTA